jgi:hypothetical protein
MTEIGRAARTCSDELRQAAPLANRAKKGVHNNATRLTTIIGQLTTSINLLNDFAEDAGHLRSDVRTAKEHVTTAQETIVPYGFHDSSQEDVKTIPVELGQAKSTLNIVEGVVSGDDLLDLNAIRGQLSTIFNEVRKVQRRWLVVNQDPAVSTLSAHLGIIADHSADYAGQSGD